MEKLLGISIFFTWVTLVAVSDIRFRRVPNALVVAGLVAALMSLFAGANPFHVLPQQALLGLLVGLAGLFPFFVLRVMGAADVKVFAVLGAWCGTHPLLWFWVVASIVAGVHSLTLILLSRTSFSALWQRGAPAMALGGRRSTPYAACLVAPAAVWLAHLIVTGGVR